MENGKKNFQIRFLVVVAAGDQIATAIARDIKGRIPRKIEIKEMFDNSADLHTIKVTFYGGLRIIINLKRYCPPDEKESIFALWDPVVVTQTDKDGQTKTEIVPINKVQELCFCHIWEDGVVKSPVEGG